MLVFVPGTSGGISEEFLAHPCLQYPPLSFGRTEKTSALWNPPSSEDGHSAPAACVYVCSDRRNHWRSVRASSHAFAQVRARWKTSRRTISQFSIEAGQMFSVIFESSDEVLCNVGRRTRILDPRGLVTRSCKQLRDHRPSCRISKISKISGNSSHYLKLDHFSEPRHSALVCHA